MEVEIGLSLIQKQPIDANPTSKGSIQTGELKSRVQKGHNPTDSITFEHVEKAKQEKKLDRESGIRGGELRDEGKSYDNVWGHLGEANWIGNQVILTVKAR